MSKFIYASSEENNIGNEPNADFRVNFHQPLEIMPNSEIRVTECRINPKNDVVEINDNNNVLVFSIGSPWGNYDGGYGSFYRVKLDNGLYKIDEGQNENFFNFHLKQKMNDAITNNSLYRGGVDVEITSGGKLKFTVAEMNASNHYYEIPTGNSITEISDGLLQDIKDSNTIQIPLNNGRTFIEPFDLSKSGAINISGDAQSYYGCSLVDGGGNNMNYFVSPPLNFFGTGDLETDSYNPIVVASFNLNQMEEGHNLSLNLIGERNKGCFYQKQSIDTPYLLDKDNWLYDFEDDPDSCILKNCLLKLCINGTVDDETKVDITILYQPKKEDDKVSLFVGEIAKNQVIKCKISVNNNLVDGRQKLKLELWDGNNDLLQTLTLDDNMDLSLFQNINPENNSSNFIIDEKGFGQASNMRVALSGYSYLNKKARFPVGIDLAFNYDPLEGANGFFNGAFQNANALEAGNGDTIVPLVVYGDKFKISQLVNLIDTFTNVTDYSSGRDFIANINPNCGSSLGLDELGFQGTDVDLYSVGMIAYDIINTNSRENALLFVSCDDLPLLNYTGNTSTGSVNKFVYSIDLNSGSGARNNIYTSKPEIDKFNKLFNQQVLRISNMRIRITNIRGQTIQNLDDHTYIVFEIRENPLMRQENLMRKMMNSMNTREIQNNSIRPTTSQFQ